MLEQAAQILGLKTDLARPSFLTRSSLFVFIRPIWANVFESAIYNRGENLACHSNAINTTWVSYVSSL